jgi:HNH endonuclease
MMGAFNKRRRPQNLDADGVLRWHGWTETPSGCWLGGGLRHIGGYGWISFERRMLLAHRLAYETWVGPIPAGLIVRHLCVNRHCIRPDHLEVGTQAQNMRDFHHQSRILKNGT